jgi:hypothetical protein
MEQRIIIHAKKSDDIDEGHLGEVVVVFEDTGDSDMISVALGTGPKYYFLPSDLGKFGEGHWLINSGKPSRDG